MKKNIVIIVCFVLIILYSTLPQKSTHNKIYPSTAIVTELDKEKDYVIITDGSGNYWEFDGVEDWEVNDFVSLLMNDNGTPNYIYDDIITQALYAGAF